MWRQKIGPYIEEYLRDRGGYDMNWLGNPIVPRNGRIGGSAPTRIFLMGEWIIGRDDMDLNQLIYTIDKNRLGCQHGRCLCGRLRGFQRGVMVLRCMARQMAIRKSNMDISEFRRRVGGKSLRDPHVREK